MKGPLAGESRMSSSLANVKKKKKVKLRDRRSYEAARNQRDPFSHSSKNTWGRRGAKVRRREELDSLSKSGQTIMDVL